MSYISESNRNNPSHVALPPQLLEPHLRPLGRRLLLDVGQVGRPGAGHRRARRQRVVPLGAGLAARTVTHSV